ncbi:TetR/AcrR family transcriptional regulator [Streptomyces sp. P9-2B-2]|uniref:TetR/AcrR family transcriptional regulator n=1 Tax=Streptomyces TaxID=1883 RepID=UPI00225525AE|nr:MULTISPECIES: TetR/AcrR family transcriptional regulator [Streptomyces]MCX4639651.1 TetR/AcrR family transcriptional regulator [Streptomyces platensis]WJY39825.1 TetR/AcrR family transcriptional regulator [Streptomyces sp. P9-2B-2]
MSEIDRNRAARAEARTRIEDAAARLFAERGFAGTTIGEIAAEAGLSKPMLYRHFDSKQELHLALLERHRDELAAAPVRELLHGAGDLDTRMTAMYDAWFGYVESHPYTWRMMFRDTTGDAEVAAFHRELQRRQRETDMALLREFVPGLPEAELEPLGEAIRSALYGLALWWLERPEQPRELLVATMTRITRGLISTVERPSPEAPSPDAPSPEASSPETSSPKAPGTAG